jgi:acetolactate decarboxylase
MHFTNYLSIIICMLFIACGNNQGTQPKNETYPDIKVVGAMKNVMWKGKLEGSIKLDSISNKAGLYGLGPQQYLTGELLINNGKSYLSKVTSDSTMEVIKTFEVSAPFFVYGNVVEWNEISLPKEIQTIADLEKFIDEKTKELKRPFTFKLSGMVKSASIHIQNLPKGTRVSSPAEAHQGQTSYALSNQVCDIVGFFSKDHQGVFTHHDSYLHMHLITQDETQMGHLDKVEFEEMKLHLPVK